MFINKEYFERLHHLIDETPWRVTDEDLKTLLHFTEGLAIKYEELKEEHSNLISQNYNHTESLKAQLIHSLLNGGRLNDK